jgi:glycosyltransferase involved in cell wall biosynthesis
LANYSQALLRSLAAPEDGDRVGIVRVLDGSVGTSARDVVGHLHKQSRSSAPAAAALLDTFDVVFVQHAFDVYGGRDGEQVLDVLEHLRAPVVTVLHTVRTDPTTHQIDVIRRLAAASDAVVVLSTAARRALVDRYGADPGHVRIIRHGVPITASRPPSETPGRPLILTWGLLTPDKGIEHAIDGLQVLRDLRPMPAYILAGRTHPRIEALHGETYRRALIQRARSSGLGAAFRSVGTYLDDAALAVLVNRADVVVLPYNCRYQTSSAVLVEALAAGKPVVATRFPHAVELLSGGAGLLVPHEDPKAIGEAVRRVLTERGLSERLTARAALEATTHSWADTARQYQQLCAQVISRRSTAC